MNRLTRYVTGRILAWAQNRKPDFVIGEPDAPYLNRHWLLPRNPLFNVYVHQFLRSDDERALHDHPWLFNASLLMQGSYLEWVPTYFYERELHDDGKWVPNPHSPVSKHRCEGAWYFRPSRAPHRVQLYKRWAEVEEGGDIFVEEVEEPVWTLFVTGPKVRTWGFHCPKGWIPWQDFCEPTNKGQIGKGCP